MDTDRDESEELLHTCLANVWRLLKFLDANLDKSKYSQEDKIMFTPNFQKLLAQATVKYLETEF